VISLLALTLGTSAAIAVEAAEGQPCPSADQVKVALASHGVAASVNPMRLRVGGNPGATSIHLFDSGGNEVLTRQLHSPAAQVDCVALADTVALIVERYLDEVEMKKLETSPVAVASVPMVAESLPPMVRTWASGLRLSGRTGREALIVPGTEAWAERRVNWNGTRWTIAAAVGGLLPESSKTTNDAATVKSLETWLAVRTGPWLHLGQHLLSLQAEVGAGAIRGSRTPDNGPTNADWGIAPWLGMSACYRHVVGESLFLEASLGGAVSLVRHELVIEFLPDKERRVVTTTPRFFGAFGLSLGLEF